MEVNFGFFVCSWVGWQVTRDVQQTLSSVLSALAAENLSIWLSLCKVSLSIEIPNLKGQSHEIFCIRVFPTNQLLLVPLEMS